MSFSVRRFPRGLLLFFLLCCFVVWLFSRTKTGIAMSAAGANPRFAEASGINVNTMRTIGTILSTVIAAVGIVIYSQGVWLCAAVHGRRVSWDLLPLPQSSLGVRR